MSFNLSWLDKKEEPYSLESVWFFAQLLNLFIDRLTTISATNDRCVSFNFIYLLY